MHCCRLLFIHCVLCIASSISSSIHVSLHKIEIWRKLTFDHGHDYEPLLIFHLVLILVTGLYIWPSTFHTPRSHVSSVTGIATAFLQKIEQHALVYSLQRAQWCVSWMHWPATLKVSLSEDLQEWIPCPKTGNADISKAVVNRALRILRDPIRREETPLSLLEQRPMCSDEDMCFRKVLVHEHRWVISLVYSPAVISIPNMPYWRYIPSRGKVWRHM